MNHRPPNPSPNPPPGRTPRARRVVLSLLLFLHHGVIGLWAPLLGLHLQNLGFGVEQVAYVFATLPIATILSPWLAGQLADRWLRSEHVLLVSLLASAAVLWQLAGVRDYPTFFRVTLLFSLIFMPTLALSSTVVFRHLENVRDEYGGVRIWGTASWIAAGLWMWLWLARPVWLPGAAASDLSDSLRFAAGLSVAVALLTLVLPSSPPTRRAESPALLAAVRMLLQRDNFVLISVSFLMALGMAFVYPLAQLYFRAQGFPSQQIAPLLSLGQVGEIAAFLLLAPCLRRFGLRTTFLLGIGFWLLRFAVWSWGGSGGLSIAAIGVHGFAFAYVFGVGQMYMHTSAPPHARASAQSLHMIITMGFGVLLSNLLAGWLSMHYSQPGPVGLVQVDYRAVYFWPAAICAVSFVLFAFGFRPTTPAADRSTETPARSPVGPPAPP